MTNVYKNFIVFKLDQCNADQALAAIDGKCGVGSPTVVGDYCMVTFWNDIGNNPDKWAKNAITNCKKILDKYKIDYKLSTFSI